MRVEAPEASSAHAKGVILVVASFPVNCGTVRVFSQSLTGDGRILNDKLHFTKSSSSLQSESLNDICSDRRLSKHGMCLIDFARCG